ncbi:MAG: cellulase family glycosylhydrolase [Armatimonadia bacterium]|nr:cellulase family glycosylhydrolase [Armatimonadia bacterium]
MLTALMLATTLVGPADRPITLDEEGTLRWADSGEEVALFGVNYYPPFYAEYQELRARGVDIEAELERDLDQFVRLGFDLIRLHCFDREFSTPDGGLVENDHVAVLDHLIAEAKERGIYTMLTPIAWWPTPGDEGGFSSHIPMADMVADPTTWPIQQRFLAEFVSHVNPETGLAYKDDPAIVAFETINEPIPPAGTPDEVITDYINAHVEAIRGTGCDKPIFFNGWGGRHQALAASEVDGCTFNWYPTGLVNGASLLRDTLGSVDRHPTAHDPVLDGLAKAVYEFDCADVPTGVLYPAMARSFRAAGIQVAAQFQYDMTACAHHNAHWMTHYLNLAYAPQRTIAIMVAGEAFRRLPRGGEYPPHPEGDVFGPFRVSHELGLSELVADDAFIYSTDTTSVPPSPENLALIAGVGSSPLIEYEGTGAYFLHHVAPGVWRLEVYPDAAWVDDPFRRRGPQSETARVLHRERAMTLRLPDLGDTFRALPAGFAEPLSAQGGRITVTPGAWELRAADAGPYAGVDPIALPPEDARGPTAYLRVPELLPADRDWQVSLTVVGSGEADDVALRWDNEGSVAAEAAGPYTFRATVPARALAGEVLRLGAEAAIAGERYRFPAELAAGEEVDGPPLPLITLDQPVEPRLDSLEAREWVDTRLPVDLAGRDLDDHEALVVRLQRAEAATSHVEVALTMGEQIGYGTVVRVPAEWAEVRVPIVELKPLWRTAVPLNLSEVTGFHIGLGAYTLPDAPDGPHGVQLADAYLDPAVDSVWRVPLLEPGAPLVLMEGTPERLRLHGTADSTVSERDGSVPGTTAFRLAAPEGFPGGSSMSAEIGLVPRLQHVAEVASSYSTLCLLARSGQSYTDQLEIVLREQDQAPFGTVIELSDEWREVRVPLASLDHFGHWDGPAGRGFEGDQLDPGRLMNLNVTFGAWLFPGHVQEPHAVEIQRIWLER